jgi:PBP1b-binding outer membrane lipoprotein LpoB
MKTKNWAMMVLMMVFFAACSQTPVDPSKPEMTVQDRANQPPRTFNQFHNDWDY